jgi:Lar family restriction alleviation protein
MTDNDNRSSAATIAPLLPCPFCGGQASLCDTGVTWLMCDDCQAEGPVAEAEREAVEKWNGRSGGAAQAPLSEAERHAIAHARYQVEHASPDNPDCHFDYELVLNLLHVIERSAQPPAAPVERSAPAAPTGDTRSGERPPASAAMGHSAGADTRCSAGSAELADWSRLPRDLYVTSVKSSDGIVYDVQCCSVPMAIGPEVRYTQAAAEPQTSWQPIETAPKDGTLVLICGFGSEGYYVADAKWDGEWLLFHPDNDDHTEPSYNVSYWMPLPAPPSELSRPEGKPHG